MSLKLSVDRINGDYCVIIRETTDDIIVKTHLDMTSDEMEDQIREYAESENVTVPDHVEPHPASV